MNVLRTIRVILALPQRVDDLEAGCRLRDQVIAALERDVDVLAALVGEFTTKPTGRPAKRSAKR